MKKFVSVALLSAGLFSMGIADTFNLKAGWNLIGSSNSVNVAKDFNKSNVIIVWRWDNGKWEYFTPDNTIKTIFVNKYNTFTNTLPNEGFWVMVSNNLTIKDVVNEENISDVNQTETGYVTGPVDNLENYLIDKPTKFELSDIAGKNFVYVGDLKDANITFNEDGNGTLIYNGKEFKLVYDNGIIKEYNLTSAKELVTYKKIKSDENGTIVLATFDNKFKTLDGWLVKENFIDANTLKYPMKFYDQMGNVITFEGNGTVIKDGISYNYDVENGKLVIKHEENEANKGYSQTDYIGIVGEVDNYFVSKDYTFSASWYIDENNKDKTFNDFIGSNQPINGYILNEDGTITPALSQAENELKDLNATYEKIDDTTIKITKCDADNNCWDDGNLVLDPETGKVTKTYYKNWRRIYSTTPIIKAGKN